MPDRPQPPLSTETIRRYFTRQSGVLSRFGLGRSSFLFQRWSVPIAFDHMNMPGDLADGFRSGLARIAAISGAALTTTDAPNFVAVGCHGQNMRGSDSALPSQSRHSDIESFLDHGRLSSRIGLGSL